MFISNEINDVEENIESFTDLINVRETIIL